MESNLGMEVEVLRGAQRAIAKYRPLLYVENDRLDRSEELLATIESLGYIAFWSVVPCYNPKNFFGNTLNVFEALSNVNLLCHHRESGILIRGLEPVQGIHDTWEKAVARMVENN